MELEGNSNSGTSAAFLERLRQKRSGPLNVIWNNAPAHCGEAVREYLRTPGLGLRLMNPRFHGGSLCRATARTEAPMRPSGAGRERACPRENGGSHGNLCLGTKALVKERVGNFLCGLSIRKDEVKDRCRTVLQSKAEGFLRESQPNHRCIVNAHPTLALV